MPGEKSKEAEIDCKLYLDMLIFSPPAWRDDFSEGGLHEPKRKIFFYL